MSEVTLNEMLSAREYRVNLQKKIIEQYKKTIICLTLNIPGPIKVFPPIPEFFELACFRIENALEENLILICHMEKSREKTGYEAIYCVDASGKYVKSIMTALEDQDDLGRLMDIDVLTTEETKISREEMGIPARKCLLCNEPAQVCGRSRRHSVDALTAHIQKIFESNDLSERK